MIHLLTFYNFLFCFFFLFHVTSEAHKPFDVTYVLIGMPCDLLQSPFLWDYRVTRVLPTQLSLLGIERAQRQWQTGPSTLCAFGRHISFYRFIICFQWNLFPIHDTTSHSSEHGSVVLKDVSVATDRLFCFCFFQQDVCRYIHVSKHFMTVLAHLTNYFSCLFVFPCKFFKENLFQKTCLEVVLPTTSCLSYPS